MPAHRLTRERACTLATLERATSHLFSPRPLTSAWLSSGGSGAAVLSSSPVSCSLLTLSFLCTLNHSSILGDVTAASANVRMLTRVDSFYYFVICQPPSSSPRTETIHRVAPMEEPSQAFSSAAPANRGVLCVGECKGRRGAERSSRRRKPALSTQLALGPRRRTGVMGS